ncbi:MAG: menaquinone biosynthesis decarboxylase, partial [Alistipes sp.]|nr:menaquinone biosynthesis decarboxylase [Alistipes sp.]
ISLFDTRFTEEYGLLLLFADECRPAKVDVEEYLRKNNIHNIKYIALFDYQAAGPMTPSDLLWLAMANSDPRRDVKLLSGGELLLDARSKHPGVGQNPKRFPNVVMSSTDTIRLVDERWAEYGLGEKIESPSRRYRKLWLSPRAEW